MTSIVKPVASDEQELRGLAPSARHSPSAWQVAGLVALVAVNLVATVGLHWYAGMGLPGSSACGGVANYVLFAQLALLGIWLALGDGRWYFRASAVVPVAMCVGYSRGIAFHLSPHLARHYLHDVTGELLGAMFFSLEWLLLLVIILVPLRKLCGWRFTLSTGEVASATKQFGLGDLMTWMIPIGGLFVVRQFNASLDPQPSSAIEWILLRLIVETGLFTVAVYAFLLPTGADSNHGRKWTIAFGLTLIIGLALAGYAYWEVAQRLAKLPPQFAARLPRISPSSIALTQLLHFLAGAGFGLANLWILRRLGYRFRHSPALSRSSTTLETAV